MPYPWKHDETLTAADLNAAFANIAALTGLLNGGSIIGTFTADGSFAKQIPGPALITGGWISANTTVGATISLGTTLGASDVLGATVIPGSASGPVPLHGINFSNSTFATNQTIFAHSTAWASMTITIIYLRV
jgi:hypothetical protein